MLLIFWMLENVGITRRRFLWSHWWQLRLCRFGKPSTPERIHETLRHGCSNTFSTTLSFLFLTYTSEVWILLVFLTKEKHSVSLCKAPIFNRLWFLQLSLRNATNLFRSSMPRKTRYPPLLTEGFSSTSVRNLFYPLIPLWMCSWIAVRRRSTFRLSEYFFSIRFGIVFPSADQQSRGFRK